MSPTIATARTVDRAELLEFLRPRHRGMLATTRRDGRPQLSPVTCGLDPDGRIVVSTYPDRAKARNAAPRPARVDRRAVGRLERRVRAGRRTAEVLDMPDALDGLVEYFRGISGEHPNWDEYRAAMQLQDKSLIRITIERWSPIATGGFPADVAARLEAKG